MSQPLELPNDPTEVQCQRAFYLLGQADAVIVSLLSDSTDQVARVQAQLWQRDLEALMAEKR